jgi:tetratricopeptide (TPR) repeat protein
MTPWLLAAILAFGIAEAGTPLPATPTVEAASTQSAIPEPGDILALPPTLRTRFHDAVVSRGASPYHRLELMMSFLFDPSGLGMTYASEATHTVEQAYLTREANCLGFTLLTLALAREAGLHAYAQYIDEVLTWHQQDSTVVQSSHVNLGIRIGPNLYTVDVASDTVIARTLPTRLTDDRLLALYYGNRAMELLLSGNLQDARPYSARALELAPGSADAWNNAGVIHLRDGEMEAARTHYARALAINNRHSGALFNLAWLYERQGLEAEAGRLRKRIDAILRNNPFQHFMRGFAAERAGDDAGAVTHYQRAIRLHSREHRFHFALARTYARLGRLEEARASLKEAMRLAGDRERGAYQARLDALQASPGR